jgi:predicted transcriptional regulator YdeE
MNSLGLACLLAAVLPVTSGIPANRPSGTQSAIPDSKQTSSAVRTEDQPAFSVIGIEVRTSNAKEAGGNGEIPQLWQRVMQEGLLEKIPGRADGGPIAVYLDYDKEEKSDYTYLLGARVTSGEKVPDGFVAVTVPAGKYAVLLTDQGALPEVMPKAWRRVWAMPAAELGGKRAFKIDYEQYPAAMDWQNAQVEIHLGLQ